MNRKITDKSYQRDNRDLNYQIKDPFECYILCNQLHTGLGNALIDTGSQVSLIKESVLTRGSNIERDISHIQGVTGDFMELKERIKLNIGDTAPHDFLVVENLPMNHDLLLGQDWLERFGFQLRIPSLGITLPAYSETLIRVPTREKRNRLVEAQELQENVLCASNVVECAGNPFCCLLTNLNRTEQTLKSFTQTQELPKLNGTFLSIVKFESSKRNHALQSQLRLVNIKEGEADIRQICTEYLDVSKLPEDKVTATSGIKHHIPTPSIPENRVITLRNYRIPEQHQEVNKQV
jgi:hypothetical protein